MNPIQKSILKVLCFFDLLDYPLSLLEIWKFLDIKADLFEVKRELAGLSMVDSSQSLHFLKNRNELVEKRLSRYALADLKFKKVLKILRFFPWVKNIAVYSSLSFSNARKESDIDLFVITKENRVWSARFFLNLFLKIFHLRPEGDDSRDKLCLSFLADENNLDLSVFNNPDDLLYLYGTAQFIFFQKEKDFFIQNPWLKEKLPNWFEHDLNFRRKMDFSSPWKKFLENVFSLIPEKTFRDFQGKILPEKIKKMKNLDTRVVVTDKTIKLHDNDKREKIKDLFQKKLKLLCLD